MHSDVHTMPSYSQQPNGTWRAHVSVKGERRTKVVRTLREAKAWGAATEAEMLRLRDTPEGDKHTLRDTLIRYRDEVTEKKQGSHHESLRIAAFLRDFPEIADLPLAEVTTPVLARWRDERLKVVSGSTVNRDINWLRNALSITRKEWHWMSHNPFEGFRFPHNAAGRERRVSPREVKLICRACGYVSGKAPVTKTQEVAHAFLVALRTAMRAGEVLSLGRANLDLAKRTATLSHKMQYLTGRPRAVPLTRHAVRLLSVLSARERCFTIDAASLEALFRKIRGRLTVLHPEIASLHFHDTRAEALTRLSRKVDVMTLARISGHKDVQMLMDHYYRESAADIAARL